MVGTLYVMAPVDACFDWRIADKKAGALLEAPDLTSPQLDLEVISYLLPGARPVDLALYWSSSISLLTLFVKEVNERGPTWEFCTMIIPTLMNSYLTKIVAPTLNISTSQLESMKMEYQKLTETISSCESLNIVMLPATPGCSMLIDLTPIIYIWKNSVVFARLTHASQEDNEFSLQEVGSQLKKLLSERQFLRMVGNLRL